MSARPPPGARGRKPSRQRRHPATNPRSAADQASRQQKGTQMEPEHDTGAAAAAGASRPAVVSVRLIGPPEVMDAALASLAASYGHAWQPSARKPSRHGGGD